MDKVNDEDRKRRLRMLEEKIVDKKSVASVDCLLVSIFQIFYSCFILKLFFICVLFIQDTVQALVADCDHQSIKRMKNIEAYLNRCK